MIRARSARARNDAAGRDRNAAGRQRVVVDDQDQDLDLDRAFGGERYDLDHQDQGQGEEFEGDLIDALADMVDRLRGVWAWWPGVAALGFLVTWSWAIRYRS
jgi:hypothetical protein